MIAENKDSCSQRDSVERKGYVRAHRSFNRIWKERDSAEPDILGKILDKGNLNRAYKRVKANKAIYEPLFSDGSYGYRPGRSAKDAIQKIKEYAEKGYTRAVVLDLSKYFDTIDHVKLLNLLRQNVKDERVIQMIKRYLKSGVMEDGVVVPTVEGSPQGGNLSPLLANIYLNEFDQEFKRRGVPCIRYADDIVLLAKSERASQRLLESSVKYLERTLNLRVNREKSRTVSVIAIRNFKYLGFCLGKGKNGVFIRVHPKSYMRFKDKLRVLTSRSRCGSIVKAMKRIEISARGWLNYFGIADMKNNIENLNGWLYKRKLVGLGLPEWAACKGAYSRKSYWRTAHTPSIQWALSKERLIHWGFYDLAIAYQSMHVNC